MSLEHSNLNFDEIRKPVFATKLNLVALMDIFTILVFFLLLNAGDSDRLENAKFIKLPESSAKAAPHVEAIIMLDEDAIWLNQDKVVEVEEVLNSKEEIITPLLEALNSFTEKKGELSVYEKENGLPVTIMGDKNVSFSLLKTVMTTCNESNYRDISLAVNRVAPQDFLLGSTSQAADSLVDQKALANSQNQKAGG
ncbi:biopolymer transporter ExbD [Aliikangiella sp. G2MR2-5]|uniref:ExbD/TolR family protein n=1 Tax=Aliikangiella sp. G2MR2-5 TaxID=2788943 RepID=UPI0018AA2DDA|nr:biopolymer transporter ExbD [Aliikangiella sp. G2MR2-5]